MSANEGAGNSNGTSAYFGNGPGVPAGASESNFFDHNPNAMNQMNQWGPPPTSQNSFPGGFPQPQQPQQSQPQQQQQAAPMFYNPAEFQKSAQGQQPEIFNPYPAGHYYQPQEQFQQEGYQQQPDGYQQQPDGYQQEPDGYQQQQQDGNQQQQQQQYGYGQQQYNQSDPVGHVPQDEQVQQQNQGSGQEQVPYQQGHAAPADNSYMFGYPANQGDGQGAPWQNQESGFGSVPQDGQPLQSYTQPGFPPAASVGSDEANVNKQDISAPAKSAEKIDQEDASSCSGFGAFFHDDDGSDFMETNGKDSAQMNENVSERTSPDICVPNSGYELQNNERIDSNAIPDGKRDDNGGSVASDQSSTFPVHSQSGTQSENHVPVLDPSLEGVPQNTVQLHTRTEGSPFMYNDNCSVSPNPVAFNPTQEQVTGTLTSSLNNGAEESPVHILPGGHDDFDQHTNLPTRESSDLDPAPLQSVPSTGLTSPEMKVADSTCAVPESQSMLASDPVVSSMPQVAELNVQEVAPPVPMFDMNQVQEPVSENDLPSRTLEPSPSSQTASADLENKIVAPVEENPVVSSPSLPPPSSQNQESLVTTAQSDQPASSVPSEADESHPSPPPPTKESQLPPPPPPQGQSSAQSGKKSDGEPTSKDRSNSLSSGSHPSAFRQVRGHHGHRDMSVNPSPPLWQAEVPPLPSNILLAPAAMNISTNFTPMVPTNPLETTSSTAAMSPATASTPRQAAASIASVVVPPLPAVVGPLISGNSNISQPIVSNSNQLATASSTTVEQVTQNVSHLDINKTVPATSASVLPPSGSVQSVPVPQQQTQTSLSNPASVVQPAPPVQAQPVQSTNQQFPNMLPSQPSQPHPAVTTAPSQQNYPADQSQLPPQAPNVATTLPHQPPSVQPPVSSQPAANVQAMQQQMPATAPSQGGPSSQPQQPPQQGQQQHSQQHPQQPQGFGPGSDASQNHQSGYGQYPAERGNWYPPQNPADRSYPQGYYPGYGGGQGYRGYGYDYGSPYGRQNPYNRQDPYYSGQQQWQRPPAARTPQRSAAEGQWERPQSRQEMERPRSRQGWGYDYDADPRYAASRSRKDPRAYRGVDEYGRPYDQRSYYEYYYNKRYSGQYRDREQYEQDRSKQRASQQYTQESQQSTPDTSQTERKDQNESFSQEFHHQGGNTPEEYGANQSSIYQQSSYDYYDQQRKRGYDYYDNSGNSSVAAADGSYYEQGYQSWQQEPTAPATPPPPERRTPVKHALPHVIARFSPGGQLIKVLPNVPSDGMPAVVEVHSIETMLEECDEVPEYKDYPGPLIKGETHKNDVLHFATAKAGECRKSTSMTDRESAALLWDLLVLLCRQNGTVVETDISDLLLKDHPMTTRESAGEETAEGDVSQEEGSILQELSKSHNIQDVTRNTYRFRELLLFGRKKEALDCAMKKGLWGHALLLASKMDNRTHASVMTRFANSLPMNDPLQTLYQLMSDRQPAAVTSCSDESWGDWRPHLAMVMSNLGSSADVGYKSVVTLGDSLSSRGLLHASQFCYLMAQMGFGIYTKKTSKMVLLGSSHNLPFNKFSTNAAIHLTEIYEYAQMLANKHFLIPNFQAYKFLYACRLADFGYTSQALRYCETIANTIQCSPNFYNSTLVNQLCQLTHRLKHHDPEFLDMREITEPHWLTPLENILVQINDGQLKPPSSAGTPMPWVESSSNLSTMGVESTDGTVHAMEDRGVVYPYDDRGGYQQQDPAQEEVTGEGQGYEQYYNQEQVSNQEQHQNEPGQQQQVPLYDYNQQQQQHQQQAQPQEDGTQQDGQQQQYYGTQYSNYQPYNTQPVSSNFQANQDPSASMGSNFSEYSTTSNATETEGESTEYEKSNASQFDFASYNQMSQQSRSRTNTQSSMGGPPSPQKTLTPPESPASFKQPSRKRTTSEGSTRSVGSDRQRQQQQHQQQKQPESKESKPQAQPKSKSTGGGWLRWFNKKIGGSNIHLPDDTKKTIEWDPVKQKWIDQDGDADEADGCPPPPPPSDTAMSGRGPPMPPASSSSAASAPPSGAGAVPPPGGNPTPTGGPAPALGGGGPPPMGANKFSRKFGAGNYVDVLNKGKGASSLAKVGGTSSLFNTLPTPASQAPVNFFIPDSSAAEDTQASNEDGQPQVGNPGSRPHSPTNQHGATQSENLSRSSSMSDLSREVSQHMQLQTSSHPPPTWPQEGGALQEQQQHPPQQQQQQAPPPPQQQQQQQPPAQPGIPLMYNPQQFPNASLSTGFGQPTSTSSSSSSRRGYGAPRQYPKQR